MTHQTHHTYQAASQALAAADLGGALASGSPYDTSYVTRYSSKRATQCSLKGVITCSALLVRSLHWGAKLVLRIALGAAPGAVLGVAFGTMLLTGGWASAQTLSTAPQAPAIAPVANRSNLDGRVSTDEPWRQIRVAAQSQGSAANGTQLISPAAARAQMQAAGLRFDAAATAKAPWPVGSVVASDRVSFMDGFGWDVQRVFLGVTDRGYWAVQDFFSASGKPLSAPYAFMRQEDVTDSDFYSQESKIDGIFAIDYPNGQAYERGQIEEGKKDGLWRHWGVDGDLRQQGSYVQGKRHGEWTTWLDGHVFMQGVYSMNSKVGLWLTRDRDGQLSEERWALPLPTPQNAQEAQAMAQAAAQAAGVTLDVAASAHAPWPVGKDVPTRKPDSLDLFSWGFARIYWGMTREGYFLVQDIWHDSRVPLTDPYVLMTADAVINGYFDFRSGAQLPPRAVDGAYMRRDGYGAPQLQGAYRHGRREGVWIWFNGERKMQQGVYRDDVPDGLWTNWDSEGHRVAERHYRAGLWDGLWQVWFASGQLQSSCTYAAGVREGVCTTWHENGRKQQEGAYLHGERVGLWHVWDEEGAVIWWHDYDTGTRQP